MLTSAPLPDTAARAAGSGPALVSPAARGGWAGTGRTRTALGQYAARPAARHVQTLGTYEGSGSRDSPHPDQDLNSTDRLWRFRAPGVTRW
ncbi:hypothetical protein ACFCX0_23730 [Streptomyces sp. NPDC056352]|uniref:hypothetical protein n=1 Tax=Streptomyces sp. NPDC056352 TaxID=3345791 RepID=UPI0035DFE160